MKTKYYLVFLALLLSQILTNKVVAQSCLLFNYDADGNRINRLVSDNCLEMKGNMEAIENVEVSDIEVYPNPTDGVVRIVLPEGISKDYACWSIYNMNGILIIEKRLANESDVDIGNVPSGVYLMKIICSDQMFYKIIVKH